MKKFFILIAFTLFLHYGYTQIVMFEEKKVDENSVTVVQYDSLKNLQRETYIKGGKTSYSYHHLIGQTLMYCGDPDATRVSGFQKGKYYKIVDILPDDVGRGLYHRFKFWDTSSGVYRYEEDGMFNRNFNFKWVVLGHYEKIKNLYKGKEYVYIGESDLIVPNKSKNDYLINLETDTVTLNIPLETVWTCVDVQVRPRSQDNHFDFHSNDSRSPIVLIFDNPTYGKHYCYYETYNGKTFQILDKDKPHLCGRFQLKSYYDTVKAKIAADAAKRKATLIKKYGPSTAKLILQGVVRTGMTKSMCKDAWGEPDCINRSMGSWGVHEQWVYGNSYLYFEGNKLTSIQD